RDRSGQRRAPAAAARLAGREREQRAHALARRERGVADRISQRARGGATRAERQLEALLESSQPIGEPAGGGRRGGCASRSGAGRARGRSRCAPRGRAQKGSSSPGGGLGMRVRAGARSGAAGGRGSSASPSSARSAGTVVGAPPSSVRRSIRFSA